MAVLPRLMTMSLTETLKRYNIIGSHFSKKNERITNVFEDCGSTQCGAIRDIGVSIEKRSEGLSQESAADPHL